jgi:hypothetical protein
MSYHDGQRILYTYTMRLHLAESGLWGYAIEESMRTIGDVWVTDTVSKSPCKYSLHVAREQAALAVGRAEKNRKARMKA